MRSFKFDLFTAIFSLLTIPSPPYLRPYRKLVLTLLFLLLILVGSYFWFSWMQILTFVILLFLTVSLIWVLNLLELLINANYCIVWVMIIIGHTLIVFRRRFNLEIVLSQHHTATQRLKQLQKVFEMYNFALSNCLSRNMVQIIFNKFGNQIDNTLNFFSCGHFSIFGKSK